MSELSWLIDLLLNHKLSLETKRHVKERITLVEEKLSHTPMGQPFVPFNYPTTTGMATVQMQQAPSTIALMQKYENFGAAPVIPGVAAATQATAMAMESRNRAIIQGETGKPEPGRTSPRKF